MDSNLRKMVFGAMFAAFIMLATMYLRIPGATGYYHLGDGLIYACAVLLGPVTGGLAAAVGSFMADMLSGYPVWAPWSMLIKGLTAVMVALLARRSRSPFRLGASMIAGALVTIVGYGLATWVMYGMPAVIPETYGNLAQTGLGIIVGMLLVWWNRTQLDELGV